MKTPFGNTVAAIKLAEIVDKTPNARKYVSTILSELGNLLYQITWVRSDKAKRHLYKMVKETFIRRIEYSDRLPNEAVSYLKNVVITKCRSFKKCADSSQV